MIQKILKLVLEKRERIPYTVEELQNDMPPKTDGTIQNRRI